MVKRKAFEINWDESALDSFEEIIEFLSKQSPQASQIVKQEIFSRLELLKSNALLFASDKLKEPHHKDFRAFVIFSYRVTYQVNFKKSEIRVIRIRHTSREPLGY